MSATLLDGYALTLDLEWAPDFIIEETAQILLKHRTKATWFITHRSPAVESLFHHPDLFELGIHPNFLPGSTHGSAPADVLAYLKKIVPQAKAMRTHSLVQSFPLFCMAKRDFGIDIDVSLLMQDVPGLQPYDFYLEGINQRLLRFPYYWEDDIETYRLPARWDLSDASFHAPGLKIFNFHPLYIYLNCISMDPYKELKQAGPMPSLSKEIIDPYVNTQPRGNKHLFLQLCKFLSDSRHPSYTISEMARLWRQGKTGLTTPSLS